MELVELVVQGLSGASEMVRVAFAPTVTVLAATPRERLYVRLVLDQLYPKGTEPTLVDLDDPKAQSRVAVTVQGRDNQRYRLLQDVHTGRRALQRVVGDKTESVTNAANEIGQAVTATIGFPQEDVMRELMFCVREDLPSQQRTRASSPKKSAAKNSKSGAPAKAKIDKPLPPGFSDEGAPVADRGGRSDEQLRQRLAEIKEQLSAQESLKDVEFEIDGLQKKVFEVEAKLRPLATLRRSVEQSEQQMQRFHSIKDVPADLPERAALLRKARAEYERDIAHLEAERDRLVNSTGTLTRDGGAQRPLDVAQKDPLVKYGAAVGAGAIAIALLGAVVAPELRWLAFLDIPAFGVALFGGIRVLSSLEHGESVRRRIIRVDSEKKRVDERMKIDEETVKGVLDKAGYALEQLPDVEEQLTARAEMQAMHEQTAAALADAQLGGDVVTLEAELAEYQGRIRKLEEQLQGAGGYGATDLAQELMEIESALNAGSRHESEPDKTIDDADYATVDDVDDDAPAVVDACKRQLELAKDVLLAESVESIANEVKARATTIIGALADGRFSEMTFSGRGETSLVDAAGGDTISFDRLPPFDRDLAWIALKVALIEVIVKRARLPVIFDRGLDAIADSKTVLLKGMLTYLASTTQVISISEKASLGGRAS